MGQADVRCDLVAGGEGGYEGVEGMATRVSYEMFGQPGTRIRQPRNEFRARPCGIVIVRLNGDWATVTAVDYESRV